MDVVKTKSTGIKTNLAEYASTGRITSRWGFRGVRTPPGEGGWLLAGDVCFTCV